jgi:hypothetical protein
MTVRTCNVACLDTYSGIEHTISVSASGLYEALGQALHILRKQPWCDQDPRRSAVSFVVRITSPKIQYRVEISDFERSLAAASRSRPR